MPRENRNVVRAAEVAEDVAREAAAEAAEMRTMAERQLEIAREKWRATEKKVTDYIDKNPRKAAMIAAGVGVALGLALGAAMRGRRR